MSNIDKQALRQTAEKAQEHGVFNMDIHSQTVLALLDDLEAAEQDSAKWFKAFEKAVSVGARYEERIAEQQRSLDHREFLLLSADQVQREYAEALGCAGDNESILEAIDDMKKRIAELEARTVKLPEPISVLHRRDFNDAHRAIYAYPEAEVDAALAAAGIGKGE
ncbi:hypothetical protein [Citrobacter sedlakii]|uniref:hypothetical protein n=1 Tax=Citrobacter sedlakii TaxID=67826 RepID=UPI00333B10CE